MDEGSGPQRVVIGASGDAPGQPVSPWARRDGGEAAVELSYAAPVEASRVPAPPPPPRPPSPDDVWRRDAAGSSLPPPTVRHPEFTYDDPEPPGATADDESGSALGGGRARWITLGLAAVLVALVVGWALGRSGGDGVAQTVDSATVTTRGPNTTVAESVLPGDTLPAASAPTTEAAPTSTRPRPTTTTTLPPVWQDATIEVDPRLAGVTDRVVVATADSLIEIDLATGATRSLPTRAGLLRQPVIGVVAGPDWLVVTPEDGSAPKVILDDGDGAATSTPIPGTEAWGLFWDAGTDRFWTMEYDPQTGTVNGVRSHDVRTGEQGDLIDTHGLWVIRGDPAGGVVVGDAAVGTFVITADGSERLPAMPLAMSRTAMVSYRCGDSLDDCGYVVVDRASGDVRPVPADVEQGALSGEWWTPPNPLPQLTGDARYAVMAVRTESAPVPALLDTETGAVVLFAGESDQFGLVQPVFSSDERFLFVVVDGVLLAHELDTGERFPVAPSGDSLSVVRAVTVRPAAG